MEVHPVDVVFLIVLHRRKPEGGLQFSVQMWKSLLPVTCMNVSNRQREMSCYDTTEHSLLALSAHSVLVRFCGHSSFDTCLCPMHSNSMSTMVVES